MKAERIRDFRGITPEGHLIRMVVWRVPEAVPPSNHAFRYRLVHVANGEHLPGFDNERGKGDHCHLDGKEQPYPFVCLERSIVDFIAEVDKRRAP